MKSGTSPRETRNRLARRRWRSFDGCSPRCARREASSIDCARERAEAESAIARARGEASATRADVEAEMDALGIDLAKVRGETQIARKTSNG